MTFTFTTRFATQSAALRAASVGILASLCIQTLTGCAPLVLGGAVAGGVLVATDRRTAGIQLEDEGIEVRAANRIREVLIERVRVNVTSYNRQVLLTGEVPSEADKQRVEQIVGRVENVRSVVNELGVMGHSSFVQRTSDSLTTGRVKASMIDAKDLYASAFRVITERGTTYLMGRVTQREADRATEITRSVPGVQRVVRVFEILTDEDLQRMLPQATQTAQPSQTPSSAASR